MIILCAVEVLLLCGCVTFEQRQTVYSPLFTDCTAFPIEFL